MLINHITIRNIGVARTLEITPGMVTIFKGANGSGKSAALKAIRSCLTKGSFAHLLADGAPEGETVLVLDDGMTIRREVSLGKSPLTVHKGALKGSWDIVESSIDKMAVNAEEFMYVNDEKKFTQLLLESMPITLDEARLRETLPGYLIPKGHPLDVLSALRKQIYDDRTGVNRVAKDKEASARELRAKIGGDQPDDTLADQLAEAERKLESALTAAATAKGEREREINDVLHGYHRVRDTAIANKTREVEAEIERLRKELAEFERREHAACDQYEAEARLRVAKQTSEYEQSEQIEIGEWRERIATLKERVRSQALLQSVSDQAKKDEAAARLAKEQSQHLSGQIDAIDQLKSDLLQGLPIRGVTVEDGVVLIDGKRIGEIPDSRRAEFTVDVAIARADMVGMPIVVMDALEKLDDARFEHMKEYLQRCGRQVFCARWSMDPELVIETLDAVTEE